MPWERETAYEQVWAGVLLLRIRRVSVAGGWRLVANLILCSGGVLFVIAFWVVSCLFCVLGGDSSVLIGCSKLTVQHVPQFLVHDLSHLL